MRIPPENRIPQGAPPRSTTVFRSRSILSMLLPDQNKQQSLSYGHCSFFETNVNNVCYFGNRDILLSNAQTDMMHVTEKRENKEKKDRKKAIEYLNEKTF